MDLSDFKDFEGVPRVSASALRTAWGAGGVDVVGPAINQRRSQLELVERIVETISRSEDPATHRRLRETWLSAGQAEMLWSLAHPGRPREEWLRVASWFAAHRRGRFTPSRREPFDDFLDDCVSLARGESIKAAALYARYQAWAATHGLAPTTSTAFGIAMRRRLARGGGHVRIYLNVRFS
jgi:hypothetical protein